MLARMADHPDLLVKLAEQALVAIVDQLKAMQSSQKPPKLTRLAEVYAAVKSFVTTWKKGVGGSIKPEDVEKALSKLKQSLSGNDAAADAALKQKFGRS